jgi:phage terminase large subunit-like protein
MPKQRLSVLELQQSGKWAHMSKVEQLERLAAETPQVFECGRPPIPPRLTPKEREMFTEICDGLEPKRLLAKSDGHFLVEYIRAKLSNDRAAQHAISDEWLGGRKPFEVALGEPVPTPTAAPVVQTVPDAEMVARRYAGDVLSGVIAAGKYIRLAAKRFLDDFDHAEERGIYFDRVAAQHVTTYISRLGLLLTTWQIFTLASVFGWKNKPTGLRRTREVLIEIGKKNGKSTLCAALCLYLADSEEGDRESPSADIFIAATSKAQSSDLVFAMCKKLRLATPSLAERTRQFKSSIVFEGSGSLIEPLCSDSQRLQGRNAQGSVLDELGDHKDTSLYSTLESSSVGRRQPLLLSISTAGKHRDGVLWERRNHAISVLESGGSDDPSLFALLYELDEGDDPFDERNWPKANPSLGSLLTIESLREKFHKAKTLLSHKTAVLRFHANVWPHTSLSPWIDFNVLDEKGNAYRTDEERALPVHERIKQAWARRITKTAVDLSKLSMSQLMALRREEVSSRPVAGGDFAVVNDLSALCILFPPAVEGGIYEAFFRIWIPEENISRRSQEDKVPYQAWADAGYVQITPGSTTDFERIEQDIVELHKQVPFELGVDKSCIPDMYQRLEKSGLKIFSVPQGFHLSPAIRRTEKLVAEHRFCHWGHPVFCWAARNVQLKIGSIKNDAQLEKQKSRERIDPAVAAVLAVFMTMSRDQPQSTATAKDPNKYEVKMVDDRKK